VIARSSTVRYKTKPEDLSEIAQELGVANFVEGSVQKVGERVRINVQLVRAGANDHVWAEIYDRTLADIFAVQSEVATAIAQALQLKLSGRERTAVAQKPTDNLAAYDAYLRGLDLNSRVWTRENRVQASDVFQEAVHLDPKFVQAWSALSQINAWLYFSQLDPIPQRAETARSAAETATRLDPSSSETLLANAYYRYLVQRDWNGARILFEKIHEQAPSNSDALVALARVSRRQNRWNDSARFFEAAGKLNPRDAFLCNERSGAFMMLRQNAAALQMIDRALEIKPNDFDLLVDKAALFDWVGNLPAAQSVIDKLASAPQTDALIDVEVNHLVLSRSYEEAENLLLKQLSKSSSRTAIANASSRQALGWIQLLAGKKENAQRTYLQAKSELEAVQREQAGNPAIAETLGYVEAGLGNKDAALREGERGVSLWPTSEDPVYGPHYEEILAGIEALVDEPDRALARIERLLTTPYLNPLNQAGLRLDPTWDRLRSLPRFKAIVEGPEPKTIYH
jgi:tetratricopeptide (TPR) repeat protein